MNRFLFIYSAAALVVGQTPECPQVCGQIVQPVCGSDAVTYSNECELQVASCKRPLESLIKVADAACPELTPCATVRCTAETECKLVPGECDAPPCTPAARCTPRVADCSSIKCEADEECQMTVVQCLVAPCPPVPTCVAVEQKSCAEVCSSDYNPVCGSNNVTYSNKCLLSIAACEIAKAGGSILQVYEGECKPSTDCSLVRCAVGTECQMKDVQCFVAPCPPVPTCVMVDPCNFPCPLNYAPICGSNNVTYSNKCFLDAGACEAAKLGVTVVPAYNGVCPVGVPSECAAVLCPVKSVCRVVNSLASCVPEGGKGDDASPLTLLVPLIVAGGFTVLVVGVLVGFAFSRRSAPVYNVPAKKLFEGLDDSFVVVKGVPAKKTEQDGFFVFDTVPANKTVDELI